MIKSLNSLDKGGNIVNLTTATADYPLAIGDTATISYTSTTSVPLRVATFDGLYEVSIAGDQSVVLGTMGSVELQPNNTTTSAGAIDYREVLITTPSDSDGAVTSSAYGNGASNVAAWIGYGLLPVAHLKISTYIKSKHIVGTVTRRTTSTSFSMATIWNNWLDTTTAWVSLGTVVFPFAQSGEIVIRRIS